MPRRNSGPKLKWIEERKTFYIVWQEGGKTRKRSTGTSDGREAHEIYLDYCNSLYAIGDGTRPDKFPVADALAYYAEHKATQAMDPARIAYAIEALLPFWEDKMVSEINQGTCTQYLQYRAERRRKGISNSTIRRELGALVAALNFCHREGKLTRVVHVPLPEKAPPKDRWLTRNEMAALLWASRCGHPRTRAYLPLYMLIGIYTGARTEAILSLTWDRVDLERRRIDFQIPGRRRTKKRRPTIPIPERLLTFLRYAYRRRTANDGPVVHNRGKPITRIIRGFKAAAKRADLPDITPHVLRHTIATWMALDGVSMYEIAAYLGQDVATTSRIYSHHSPDFLNDAIRSLDRRTK
ncbi:site-specific integrase [Erythrobacter sp.]|uniref:tyrosine-type recombinase/integrase n=1 Tax=Erythrobacter sp. TaxID=1042 RepID=UPI00142601FC|nr:site-specific integrase [Erythrobacter sp.]QIQ86257.1 MAG: site-specific integrase [Erythrobacter sp.]